MKPIDQFNQASLLLSDLKTEMYRKLTDIQRYHHDNNKLKPQDAIIVAKVALMLGIELNSNLYNINGSPNSDDFDPDDLYLIDKMPQALYSDDMSK